MADKVTIEQLKRQITAIEDAGCRPRKAGERPAAASARSSRDKDLASGRDALGKIVALVNVSDRSERAVRDRLAKEGFTEPAIEQAIGDAIRYGYIDDMRYGAVLVRSRLSQGKGAQGIARELAAQGIDIAEIPGWPFEFEVTDETEFERAYALLEKRPPRSKNVRDSAYRRLVNKGFSSEIASSAARAWSESRAAG